MTKDEARILAAELAAELAATLSAETEHDPTPEQFGVVHVNDAWYVEYQDRIDAEPDRQPDGGGSGFAIRASATKPDVYAVCQWSSEGEGWVHVSRDLCFEVIV